MFQLTLQEWEELQLKAQDITDVHSLRSQFVILKNGRGKHLKYLPFSFTEQGVAMLSSVLHSDKAVSMNIAIIRAFVELRKIIFIQTDIKEQLQQLREKLSNHDTQLNIIYDALENLIDEKAAQRKWDNRDRIGFK